jgi:P-type Cu+ transporter
MNAQPRPVAPDEDPVCGMHVDPATAKAKGLVHAHEGREYVFCGKGCMLEFRDEPNTYLDPNHLPMM